MASNELESLPLDEALKTALANGEAEQFRDIFRTRHEELSRLNPTEQTYLEAWDNNIRVRQDRKDPNEPLIWEEEKSHVMEFLSELQSRPLLAEEAAQIREVVRGSASIQSMENAVLEGWDLKASAMKAHVSKAPAVKAEAPVSKPQAAPMQGSTMTPAAEAAEAAAKASAKAASTPVSKTAEPTKTIEPGKGPETPKPSSTS